MTEYLNVGKIVNTQGIKGEVRVISKTDFSNERYKKGNELFLFQENKKPISLIIKSHRKHKNFDIVSFEGHPNINDVEKYRAYSLKIAAEDRAELESDDEFYYDDIIGLTVIEDGVEIGKVKEILQPGANDVWVIKRKGKKDLLLPFIESVVLSVDIAGNCVTVEVPQGLDD